MSTTSHATLDRDVDGFGVLKILRFAEFPEELKTKSMAHQWFRHKMKVAKEPLIVCFDEIPASLRSHELMLCAIREADVNVLRVLDAHLTPDYVMYAKAVTQHNYKLIDSVEPGVRGQILPGFCWDNTVRVHQIARDFEWFRGELTDDLFNHCCLNFEFALDSPEEMLSEEFLQQAFVKNNNVYELVRASGRLNLLVDRTVAGDWPQESSDYAFAGEKPKSLEDGVRLLSETVPGKDHETLYMAYVMSHPIETVVPLMRGQRLQKLLVEMYSFDVLKPFMKGSNSLRGVVLEEAMGL